ncbi:hypothetical protein NDU88_002173, partial [Pleurodeles waltl]
NLYRPEKPKQKRETRFRIETHKDLVNANDQESIRFLSQPGRVMFKMKGRGSDAHPSAKSCRWILEGTPAYRLLLGTIVEWRPETSWRMSCRRFWSSTSNKMNLEMLTHQNIA